MYNKVWYMFKVNNKDTIGVIGVVLVSLLLTLNVNFEHISHLVLVFQLLTLNM